MMSRIAMPKMKKKQQKKGRRTYGPSPTPVVSRVKMPYRRNGEMFARVVEIFGQDRMGVFCEDGKHRIGRIRGKIKKRVWIRKGDLVVINPWEFETQVDGKLEKCEISWRYLRHEVSYLERKGRIPEVLEFDNIPIF
jgi:translation initiation factor 1A